MQELISKGIGSFSFESRLFDRERLLGEFIQRRCFDMTKSAVRHRHTGLQIAASFKHLGCKSRDRIAGQRGRDRLRLC